MTEESIKSQILENLAGVDAVEADGNTFFFYDPDHMMPLATLVTNDLYDTVSELSRPGVFRLNIGVGKETFRSLLGDAACEDFTVTDRWLPHPSCGPMFWICVLNPTEATFEQAKSFLAEAHERAVGKYGGRPANG